jgi:hypothetical protein
MTQAGRTPPATPEEALDQVFLTPRVVDQRAIEEMTGSLRGLVTDAAAQSRALAAASTEVKLLSENLREAARELQSRVELAVRVVPTIDQRVGTAERLLETTAAGMTERLREAAESVVKDDEHVRRRVTEAVERAAGEAAGRLEEIQTRLNVATARCEELLDRLGEAQRTIDAATDGAVVRITGLLERLQAAERQATMPEPQATEACVRLGAAMSEAERRAQVFATGLEASLADAERRAGEIAERAARVQTERLEQAAERARTVGDGLARLVNEADRMGQALDRLVRQARSGGTGT